MDALKMCLSSGVMTRHVSGSWWPLNERISAGPGSRICGTQTIDTHYALTPTLQCQVSFIIHFGENDQNGIGYGYVPFWRLLCVVCRFAPTETKTQKDYFARRIMHCFQISSSWVVHFHLHTTTEKSDGRFDHTHPTSSPTDVAVPLRANRTARRPDY